MGVVMEPDESTRAEGAITADQIPFEAREQPSVAISEALRIIDEIEKQSAEERVGLVQRLLVPVLARLRGADLDDVVRIAKEKLGVGIGVLRQAVPSLGFTGPDQRSVAFHKPREVHRLAAPVPVHRSLPAHL